VGGYRHSTFGADFGRMSATGADLGPCDGTPLGTAAKEPPGHIEGAPVLRYAMPMSKALEATVHLDGKKLLWVSVGPDSDPRAEPLARRAHEVLRLAVGRDAISAPTEPFNDVDVWMFSAVSDRAHEAEITMRDFLVAEGCVIREVEPSEGGWG